MATECTQESVLSFLLENGGRVKNKVLVEHYKGFLSSDNTKRTLLKERFKRFVDNIAYVKQEDGEKVVCLKKKYRGMLRDENKGKNDSVNAEMHATHDTIRESDAIVDETRDALCISDIALTENMKESTGNLEPHAPQIPVIRRRSSRGSQRSSFEDAGDGDVMAADGTPKGRRRTFMELMKSSSPQVRRSLVRRTSQEHLPAPPHPSSAEEDCVTLDPLEHDWMMRAADGEWEPLRRLLGLEPALVGKKDFVTGFTCLHWAAKQGKHELLATLVNFAKQHNVAINLNARSSAGYTPLHLAAMHEHVDVMKLLVGAYDVDVDVRDYNGKKAAQYLRATVGSDVREIVGAGAGPRSNSNPLRLLNAPEEPLTSPDAHVKPRALYRKPSMGRIRLQRNRFKTQIVHSTSFRENDEREESPVRTRPVSNLFG